MKESLDSMARQDARELRTGGIRQKIEAYTAVPIIALTTFLFLTIVAFLPGAPLLPTLIAVGLGISSYKKPNWSTEILGLLVFLSILWQLVGFGLLEIAKESTAANLVIFGVLFVALLSSLSSSRLRPTTVALAILSVALMLTPYYYFSIPVIVAAAAIGDLSSIGALSLTFVLNLIPFFMIENALYFIVSLSGRIGEPIVFSQLTYFADNMRPPLPGLNVFLTGLPSNYYSTYMQGIVSALTGGMLYVMIVPIVLFAVVFSVSASIAGLIDSLIKHLKIFESTRRLLRVVSPFIVSMVTPLAFTFLLTALSSKSIGGYQTALNNDPGHIVLFTMVLSSVALGGVFTAREVLIQRFERVEFAKRDLFNTLDDVERTLSDIRKDVLMILKGAPSLELGSENQAVTEAASYIADLRKDAAGAGYETLVKWIDTLQNHMFPTLKGLPEVLRIKIVNELNTLDTLAATFNASIEVVGVEQRFPELESSVRELGVEEALEEYQKTVHGIRVTSLALYESYTRTVSSYNTIMGYKIIIPPVNPEPLLDSKDYVTVMKLIAEEYWLNFHTGHEEEFGERTAALVRNISNLRSKISSNLSQKLSDMSLAFLNVRPVDASIVLARLNELSRIFAEIVEVIKSENENLNRMIRTLMPTMTTVISFETEDQMNRIQRLGDELKVSKSDFGDMTGFSKSLTFVLADLLELRKRDKEKLITISQYPMAKRLIRMLYSAKGFVEVDDLPYRHDIAVLYLRFYAASTPELRYDEEQESVRIAKMY